MSYLKEVVVKVLQLGIGEEFNIILEDGKRSVLNPFKFTDNDLVCTEGSSCSEYLLPLLNGECTIEKIHFAPKMSDKDMEDC